MNTRYVIKGAILLLISSTFAIPALAASDPAAMTKRLDSFAKQVLKKYSPANKPRLGNLEPSSSIELAFRLRKGQKYGFATVCDNNCKDIDLRLKDEEGQVIEEDTDADNTAYVVYTAEADGIYDAEVIMYDCSSKECGYALGPYRR